MRFQNREDAGILLAQKLAFLKDKKDAVIIGLTRGGVVTAKVIAANLSLSLFPLVVKKISPHTNPELALGATTRGNTVFWDKTLLAQFQIDKITQANLLRVKEDERKQKEKLLGKRLPSLKENTVVVVDDGVATGATARVAALFLRKKNAKKLILATPIIAKSTYDSLQEYYDSIVFLVRPVTFRAVGEFYNDFHEVSDQDVVSLLR